MNNFGTHRYAWFSIMWNTCANRHMSSIIPGVCSWAMFPRRNCQTTCRSSRFSFAHKIETLSWSSKFFRAIWASLRASFQFSDKFSCRQCWTRAILRKAYKSNPLLNLTLEYSFMLRNLTYVKHIALAHAMDYSSWYLLPISILDLQPCLNSTLNPLFKAR